MLWVKVASALEGLKFLCQFFATWKIDLFMWGTQFKAILINLPITSSINFRICRCAVEQSIKCVFTLKLHFFNYSIKHFLNHKKVCGLMSMLFFLYPDGKLI